MEQIKKARVIDGFVVNNSNQNSVTVLVSRLKTNSIYNKKYSISKKYIADCREKIEVGSKVKITETKPISKTKRYKVMED